MCTSSNIPRSVVFKSAKIVEKDTNITLPELERFYNKTMPSGPQILQHRMIAMYRQSNFCISLLQNHGIPGAWGSHISRKSKYEGGKFVSPTHRPPLRLTLLICVRGWVGPRTIFWPGGLYQLKMTVTQSEIKPATFRLTEKCHNQLHHGVLPGRNKVNN